MVPTVVAHYFDLLQLVFEWCLRLLLPVPFLWKWRNQLSPPHPNHTLLGGVSGRSDAIDETDMCWQGMQRPCMILCHPPWSGLIWCLNLGPKTTIFGRWKLFKLVFP